MLRDQLPSNPSKQGEVSVNGLEMYYEVHGTGHGTSGVILIKSNPGGAVS
ncbi:MAG TPA: hypothetical protein VFY26_06370 [Anaerolineales bacterium]|nr:hypothetical protein [Anaerolineales bacterium]